jgi:hypothetical protein
LPGCGLSFFFDATITEDAMPNRSLFIAAGMLLGLDRTCGPCPTGRRRGAEPPRHPPAFAEQTEAPERVSSFVAEPALDRGRP